MPPLGFDGHGHFSEAGEPVLRPSARPQQPDMNDSTKRVVVVAAVAAAAAAAWFVWRQHKRAQEEAATQQLKQPPAAAPAGGDTPRTPGGGKSTATILGDGDGSPEGAVGGAGGAPASEASSAATGAQPAPGAHEGSAPGGGTPAATLEAVLAASRGAGDGRVPAVILYSGRFAPVTSGHIRALADAVHYVRSLGGFRPVLAVVSPVHDDVIQRKLDSADVLPATERAELLRAAADDLAERWHAAVGAQVPLLVDTAESERPEVASTDVVLEAFARRVGVGHRSGSGVDATVFWVASAPRAPAPAVLSLGVHALYAVSAVSSGQELIRSLRRQAARAGTADSDLLQQLHSTVHSGGDLAGASEAARQAARAGDEHALAAALPGMPRTVAAILSNGYWAPPQPDAAREDAAVRLQAHVRGHLERSRLSRARAAESGRAAQEDAHAPLPRADEPLPHAEGAPPAQPKRRRSIIDRAKDFVARRRSRTNSSGDSAEAARADASAMASGSAPAVGSDSAVASERAPTIGEEDAPAVAGGDADASHDADAAPGSPPAADVSYGEGEYGKLSPPSGGAQRPDGAGGATESASMTEVTEVTEVTESGSISDAEFFDSRSGGEAADPSFAPASPAMAPAQPPATTPTPKRRSSVFQRLTSAFSSRHASAAAADESSSAAADDAQGEKHEDDAVVARGKALQQSLAVADGPEPSPATGTTTADDSPYQFESASSSDDDDAAADDVDDNDDDGDDVDGEAVEGGKAAEGRPAAQDADGVSAAAETAVGVAHDGAGRGGAARDDAAAAVVVPALSAKTDGAGAAAAAPAR